MIFLSQIHQLRQHGRVIRRDATVIELLGVQIGLLHFSGEAIQVLHLCFELAVSQFLLDVGARLAGADGAPRQHKAHADEGIQREDRAQQQEMQIQFGEEFSAHGVEFLLSTPAFGFLAGR
jgi:hypothetical protein